MLYPLVKVGLQFLDGFIHFLSKRYPVELVEHRFVKPLTDPVGLRTLGLGARMIDIQCPRYSGLMVVKLLEAGRNTVLQAINGFCPRCRHRLAWIVSTGNQRLLTRISRRHG